MTNDEAKFMLQGYRPNGEDADNEAFAAALAQAERDPTLREWFEREQAFDTVIAGKLREVAVPEGLRESVLAGTKLSSGTTKSSRPRAWWARSWTIGLAAAAAVVMALTINFNRAGQPIASLPRVDAMLQLALDEYRGVHPMGPHADALGTFGAWLESPATALSASTMPADLAALKLDGCRSVSVAGHDVFEICFRRGDAWFHVYLAPRTEFDPQSIHAEPMFHEQGQFVAASWADDKFVYLVSSTAGLATLRGIL
ncbi:hypothetical protein [Synoicihabitans lomoniglobus]|uniref:Uncharacterized protein n=1 Tax=Synoicihabitans lomoniglobus TaxID=2909285 RepID=A0AAF0I3M0_9BACT|nr:hypothetical protein [Opitutaceae bacterium LMO-M01]WED66224.1 hypothetical protein PXH66_05110 [Opitutaceae bacterium LMO-M01]